MIDMYRLDWNDQEILSRGRLAPRIHFYPYGNTADACCGGDTERVEHLTGSWNFNWFSSPFEVPASLLETKYDPAAPSIPVPINWQYEGYGTFCYTDVLYPFPVDPPHVPAQNETGVYRRAFKAATAPGEHLMLRFEGVESAFHVYVNGREAGYSQGSRMPSEFDITELVIPGENQLAVVVYQYSDGTYLEDQDMWWLGGITRDVLLLHRPACYLKDFVLDPDYEGGSGLLHPRTPLSDPQGRVELTIYDPEGKKIPIETEENRICVPQVRPWTAETPVLYTVVATVYDGEGQVTEAIPQRIGFRHVAVEDGVLTINGRPVFLRGVNRHEYDPKTGRAITREMTEKELKLIKKAGLNAIRCSHYPNNPFFYDLCEEIGLYVIDECDLETHGFEALGKETQLNSDPQWREAYLDRIQRMVGRDRNRACVVMWSLGNESAYGPNFKAMYDWCKANEPSRPIHYEGDFKNQTVDVSSTMYSTIGRLKELDTQLEPKRPHIHCEFGHAMGNGPGSLKEYFEMSEHSQRIQGIFVWEFKDHGVYTQLPDGGECYRYGGEFGEKFHDGNFCMDGLVRSDGVPTPGFWEYARVAEPIHVERFDLARGLAYVKNRFDFLDLSAFRCHGLVKWDGTARKTFALDLPEAPARSVTELQLPEGLLEGSPKGVLVTLKLEFVSWKPVWSQSEAGWVAGRACAVLQEEAAAERGKRVPAHCQQDGYLLNVSGKNFSFRLDPVLGRIRNYRVGGVLLMEDGPMLNYNRAYTDNDMSNKEHWDKKHLHSMRMVVSSIDWQQEEETLKILVKGKFSPDAMDWGTDVTVAYQVWEDGALNVSFEGDFFGPLPTELPKIGTETHLPDTLHYVTWRGYGPGECYCDSREAQSDDVWYQEAREMSFAYSCPQENANRTGVRWAVFSGDEGHGLAVAASHPIDLAVRPYSDEQLRTAKHSCELEPDPQRLYVHLDHRNSGLGSGSCGPTALAQYKAYPIHYQWELAFAPLASGETPIQGGRRALGQLKK